MLNSNTGIAISTWVKL